jgi:hypothetical protein
MVYELTNPKLWFCPRNKIWGKSVRFLKTVITVLKKHVRFLKTVIPVLKKHIRFLKTVITVLRKHVGFLKTVITVFKKHFRFLKTVITVLKKHIIFAKTVITVLYIYYTLFHLYKTTAKRKATKFANLSLLNIMITIYTDNLFIRSI